MTVRAKPKNYFSNRTDMVWTNGFSGLGLDDDDDDDDGDGQSWNASLDCLSDPWLRLEASNNSKKEAD